MSCSTSEVFGPVVCWSLKDTVNYNPIPASAPRESASMKRKIRVSLDMQNDSGNCKIRVGIRMSNDGVTWDTAVAVGTVTRTANGSTTDTGYVDMASTLDAKRLAMIVVECINESGAVLEMCIANVQLDFKD